MSRPTTALIVDDEAHVRTYLKLLLRELGIATCGEAADGEQALAAIERLNPELVLLDLNMPITGGLEVLRQINEARPELPVIVVSSQSAVKVVQEVARLGAIGYVLKHSPKAQALAMLHEALESLNGSAAALDDGQAE